MSRVIAGMTMSLDGFVADREGGVGALYSDFEAMQESDAIATAIDETGAVLMGRKTFDMAGDPDGYADTYEFQVPIIVVTHAPPPRHPRENDRLTFTFVTDGVEPALAIATEAAGERAVTVVGGAEIIRELLRAGLVDELRIDIMPVFLGAGLRLFDDPALEGIGLELMDLRRSGARASLEYRVTASPNGSHPAASHDQGT
jgi:dihydrofolate reductase